MKEWCKFCHFFSDYEMVRTVKWIKDYETKEKREMVYYAKIYIGQAVYTDKYGKFVCLPCATMLRYEKLQKKRTYSPKSELYPSAS